jgi:hypothetical protein
MPASKRQIAPVVRKVPLKDQGSEFAYWLAQPPRDRLAALEEIRREYYGAEAYSALGLQRGH